MVCVTIDAVAATAAGETLILFNHACLLHQICSINVLDRIAQPFRDNCVKLIKYCFALRSETDCVCRPILEVIQ